jgi:hypothetical protein
MCMNDMGDAKVLMSPTVQGLVFIHFKERVFVSCPKTPALADCSFGKAKF